MALQGISTGTGPNIGDGDTLVAGAVKINENFTEIYDALGDGSTINAIIEPDGIDTVSIVGTGLTINGDVDLGNSITSSVGVEGTLTVGSAATISGILDVNTRAEIDNVRIDGNTVDTTSGNLTLDSNGGTIDINDDVDIRGTLGVDGNVTLGNQTTDTVTVTGILDVDTRAEIDNVRIDGNTVDTTSGNLTLDSNSGKVIIDDNVSVAGTSIFSGISTFNEEGLF